MMHTRRNRLAIVLCLLALLTAAACTPEAVNVSAPNENSQQNQGSDLNEGSDLSGESEQNDESENSEEPEVIDEPEPTELVFNDEVDDVRSLISGNPASDWGPGLDIYSVAMGVDPESGRMVYRVSTPGIEDPTAFVGANPNWGLIIAGDGDPEGTPALPGMEIFGMGQWHLGCFTYTGEFNCELWIRQNGQFVQEGEAFGGEFVDGAWTITSPMGFPRPGDRIGVAVVDPYYFDTLGLEEWQPTIVIDQLEIEY